MRPRNWNGMDREAFFKRVICTFCIGDVKGDGS